MIKQITKEVFCFEFEKFGSKVYLIKPKLILIDTSSKINREELLKNLNWLKMNPTHIKIVLLTHMHADHIGNLELFKKAKIMVSEAEIKSLKENPYATTFIEDKQTLKSILSLNLIPARSFNKIKVIKTPGHTCGSVCYLYKSILFSGDTIFDKKFKAIGRTDLPTSLPLKMKKTLNKLKKIKYSILCPGH